MIPRLRLFVAVCLFAGWIGYLAYLVSITHDQVILSRPQFLVADLYVLAELGPDAKDPKKPSGTIRVLKVFWPMDDAHRQLEGKEITLDNLEKCEESNGWKHKGAYIVPLSKSSVRDDGKHLETYELTMIPLSPGFHHNHNTFDYLRIYPDTDQAKQQLTELIAEYHGGKE